MEFKQRTHHEFSFSTYITRCCFRHYNIIIHNHGTPRITIVSGNTTTTVTGYHLPCILRYSARFYDFVLYYRILKHYNIRGTEFNMVGYYFSRYDNKIYLNFTLSHIILHGFYVEYLQ